MNEASAALLSAMPFAELLGVELLEAAPDVVRIQIEWTPERYTAGGLLHGAVLTGLADICGGLGFLNLPKGAVGTATIESKTNTLRGVRSGRVIATARPLHRGRTTIVIETELHAATRLVAKVTQTQTVLTPRTQDQT